MEARLTIVGGRTNKKQVVLQLPVVIGRSREAGLTIAHAMVSRQHCQIFEENGTLRVRDLGSLNGTFVGQRQIEETALVPGDELTVGPLTFRVEYSAFEAPRVLRPKRVEQSQSAAMPSAASGWTPPETVPAPLVAPAVTPDAAPFISNSLFSSDDQPDEPVIDLGSLVDEPEGIQPPEEILLEEVAEEDCVEEICERPVTEEPKGLFSDLPPLVSEVAPEVVSEVVPEVIPAPELEAASSSVSAVFEDVPAVEEVLSDVRPEVEEPELVVELEEISENAAEEASTPIELESSPPPVAASSAQGKKRGWWPFGGKNGSVKAAQPASATQPPGNGSSFLEGISPGEAEPASLSANQVEVEAEVLEGGQDSPPDDAADEFSPPPPLSPSKDGSGDSGLEAFFRDLQK